MAAAEIEMVVRRPDFDYTDTPHNWLPNHPALGYQLNGGSLTLPYLEPYLIRVMRQAKQALADRRPDLAGSLARDIDLFNGQEANHFKLHARYNAMLRDRYEGIAELEAEIEADFARMLREESLAWNLGYSAGFETTGMIIAQIFFDGVAEALEDADPAVRGLWGWHLAEEYEHRCVAFDVFRALGGSYRERLRLFFYQSKHLYGFGDRAARLMRAQDERDGRLRITPEEAARHRALERKQARYTRRKLVAALMPWHDPRRHAPLGPADRFLADLDWR